MVKDRQRSHPQTFRLATVPFHKLGQPLFQVGFGAVAEDRSSFADISPGDRDVAGLSRLLPATSRSAGHLLERDDEVIEHDRAGIAEIKDFVASGAAEPGTPAQRRAYSIDDIVNIGVISPAGAITEDRQLLSMLNAGGEFVDCQIRSLAGAVNREKAEARDVESKQMRISVGNGFCGKLAGRIRRDGTKKVIIFTERAWRGISVDGTGGAQDEISGAMATGSFQQDRSAARIDPFVLQRMFDRRPDSGASSQVNHGGRAKVGKSAVNRCVVANIAFKQECAARLYDPRDIVSLPCVRVERVKVVQNCDATAMTQKSLANMRPDKTGAARDENAVHRTAL
jgi:hypothetical protein